MLVAIQVTHLFVPKMVYPQRMTLREIETLRALHATDELDAAMKPLAENLFRIPRLPNPISPLNVCLPLQFSHFKPA